MRKPLIFVVSFVTLFLVLYTYFSLRPHAEARRIASELREVVQVAPHVQVMAVGNTVFVMGEVDSQETASFLRNVVDAVNHGGKSSILISNMTRLSEAAKKAMAENIERAIDSPQITVSFVKDRIFLEGIADNDFEADRAVEFAKSYLAAGSQKLQEEREPAHTGVEMAGKPSGSHSYELLDLLRVRPKKK
jgi:BON domain